MVPLLSGAFLKPYLVGAITAPLVAAVLTPLLRGTVKAAVSLGSQAKQLAAEARAEMTSGDSGPPTSAPKTPAASVSAPRKP
jgi:hypothetical protein